MILEVALSFHRGPGGDRKLNRIYGVDSEEPIGAWLFFQILKE